jgi:hypothetical protein
MADMDDQAIHLLQSRLARARILITPTFGQPSVHDLQRAEEHLTAAVETLREWLNPDPLPIVANHRVDATDTPLDARRGGSTSVAITRLIEEVRYGAVTDPTAYNRVYNRHNR